MSRKKKSKPASEKVTRTFVEPNVPLIFDKLRWEVSQIHALEQLNTCGVFVVANAAITAWHAVEWLCALPEAGHKLRIEEQYPPSDRGDKRDLKARVAAAEPFLGACRSICTSWKHTKVEWPLGGETRAVIEMVEAEHPLPLSKSFRVRGQISDGTQYFDVVEFFEGALARLESIAANAGIETISRPPLPTVRKETEAF